MGRVWREKELFLFSFLVFSTSSSPRDQKEKELSVLLLGSLLGGIESRRGDLDVSKDLVDHLRILHGLEQILLLGRSISLTTKHVDGRLGSCDKKKKKKVRSVINTFFFFFFSSLF